MAEVRIGDRRVALAFPQTYVNLSGESVALLVRRHGITDPDRMVVVHDELDLPLGRVKIKEGGGLAGHNGLRSIKAHLHTDDFLRVRIGVDKPPSKEQGADHVLRRVSKRERAELDIAVQEAADAVEAILADGVAAAMNRFNYPGTPRPGTGLTSRPCAGPPDRLASLAGFGPPFAEPPLAQDDARHHQREELADAPEQPRCGALVGQPGIGVGRDRSSRRQQRQAHHRVERHRRQEDQQSGAERRPVRQRVDAHQHGEEQNARQHHVRVHQQVDGIVAGGDVEQRGEVDRHQPAAEQAPGDDRAGEHARRAGCGAPSAAPAGRRSGRLQGERERGRQHDQQRHDQAQQGVLHHVDPEAVVLVPPDARLGGYDGDRHRSGQRRTPGRRPAPAPAGKPTHAHGVQHRGHRYQHQGCRIDLPMEGEVAGAGSDTAGHGTGTDHPTVGRASGTTAGVSVTAEPTAPARTPPSPLGVGVVVWLASELMFFAGLFAAYFSLRSINDTWPPDDVELATARTAVATVVLVASSGAMHLAVVAAEARRPPGRSALAGVTALMGTLFLTNQVVGVRRRPISASTTMPTARSST